MASTSRGGRADNPVCTIRWQAIEGGQGKLASLEWRIDLQKCTGQVSPFVENAQFQVGYLGPGRKEFFEECEQTVLCLSDVWINEKVYNRSEYVMSEYVTPLSERECTQH